jgi:antitoxin component YwqK of YwqJK toxin-antitoxin module
MKRLFLLLSLCDCCLSGNAQLLLSPANSDQQRNASDEKLTGYYSNGNKQYEGFKRKENLHGQWNSWYNNRQRLDTGLLVKGIPDGTWFTYYSDGKLQFTRSYSSEKWQQFQNEKARYHPKKISMPITTLYHDNKKQAEKYITAINTYCAMQNCTRANEKLQETIDNNAAQHYHPVFENALLHGAFVNYFPNGTIKDSGNYKNGLPEGLWIKWTDDKQFYWKGYYQHGLKNSEWKLYSSDAKLIRIVFYRNDKYLWRKDLKEGIEIEE